MRLLCVINGVGGVRATITQPIMFTAIPTTAYWLSNQSGAQQLDACILEI